MRKRFQRELVRTAKGLGEFDAVDGIDVLPDDPDAIAAWFGAHGFNVASGGYQPRG